jgi:small subunit ribosomal protein S20
VAHSLSAKKRIRQNDKARARNRARRTTIKTHLRDCREQLLHGSFESADAAYRKVCKILDRAANHGTIHGNAAARRKSRLAKRLAAMQQKQAAPSA